MKRIVALLILTALIFMITGCSNNEMKGSSANTETTVGGTVRNQAAISDTDIETTTKNTEEAEKQVSADVDYDLTAMSGEMVYALVYQMMVDPDSYIGKKVRMDGLYYASYYESTAQYYYYCVIQDATACCAQGLEFVWDDGSHVYPDEYPEDNTEVVVQGIFETYEEEGYLYCRLKDASLEITGN